MAGLDVWLTPDDAASDKKLAEIFTGLSRNHPPRPDQLVSAGRVIEIPKAARDIAFADFDQLCGTALAARDYLLLADRYAGLVLSHIPLMGDAEQNEARRFMWLVDALYDGGGFWLPRQLHRRMGFIRAASGNLNLSEPDHGWFRWPGWHEGHAFTADYTLSEPANLGR